MDKNLSILYLEDNADDAELIQYTLKKAGLVFSMTLVQSEKEYVSALTGSAPDIILSDHSLPSFNSTQAFELMQQLRPGTPFVLLTGSVSEQFAVDCLLSGIDDYILKNSLMRLPSSIERILSKKKLSIEKETIQKLHTQLKEAFREIEARNKEITDSINYAKRIQDAILPDYNITESGFCGGFIIYKPRDIVSGDLYWLARTTTSDSRSLGLKIIAAVDCTGHGVPGAFMSLLVSELLNQTLKNKDINSPADVLSYLNHKLPAALNRNNKERITDGLDMSLCAYDTVNRVIYFAGANRPLWISRPCGDTYEFIEYKGTKASIGDHTPLEQSFENHVIPVLPGDRLYLFSDGLTDQFGGPAGKKLGRQAFKELLINSRHLSACNQKKHIEEFFNAWQGSLDQVDDMLLICIEIS